MGDYGDYHNHVAAGEPGYVMNDEHEDWSWMHSARTNNTSGYVAEELEHSYPQVEGATTSSGYGHRRVQSASGDHMGFLHSEEDKLAKEKTKKKKKKKKNRQLERLQEPTDAHSDPGCGDGTSCDYSRSQSIDLVSSWLQDASLGNSAGSHAPPERRPPPRRHPPGADMVARSVSLTNQKVAGHYETDESQENQLALYVDPAPAGSNKPLDNVMKLVKIKAAELASVSKTAAVNIKRGTIAAKNMAAPVMRPMIDAMIEESTKQLLGSDGMNGIFNQPGRPNSLGRGRIGGRGGRGGPMPRPMYGQPPMMEDMPLGPRSGMIPRPANGLMPRPANGLMPRPANGLMPRPVIRPGMGPPPPGTMARPGIMPRPLIRPGMGPPPPGTMVVRGQGVVAMRGQPRPRGEPCL